MYNFESGRAVNKEIESALQEVQDLLNLVDVLARATGNFLNATGGQSEEGKCFSDNVSSWLFDDRTTNLAALRRRERALRAAQADREQFGSSRNGNQEDFSLATTSNDSRQSSQPEFSSLGSSADGQNLASSYYSRQLVSHHVSSHTDYKSPRSRYLDNQVEVVTAIRQRLAAFETIPKSACELVGPISSPSNTADKKFSSGRTVAISGSAYHNVKSYVEKSKSLFGDFAGPNNPDYKLPWETRKGARSQHIRNRSSIVTEPLPSST